MINSDMEPSITMDASTVFHQLINKIENSQLNYVISKTPFSANITIKRSFIKYFDAPLRTAAIVIQATSDLGNRKLAEKEKSFTALKEEKDAVEEKLDQEKMKVKSLESNVGQFREELLIVKKERNALNSTLNKLETERDDLKLQSTKKCKTIKDLQNDLIEKDKILKAKDSECDHLNKGNKEMKKRLEESLLKLVIMKEEKVLENNNMVNFKCSLCDFKHESAVELSAHVRENHYKDQVSQTKTPSNEITTIQREKKDETYEYPCFYCGQIISSKESLQSHQIECHNSDLGFHDRIYRETYFHPVLPAFPHHPPFLLPLEVSCYKCCEKFKNKSELRTHCNASHPDLVLFWCDFCLTNFGSERGLQSHIRNKHKDYV